MFLLGDVPYVVSCIRSHNCTLLRRHRNCQGTRDLLSIRRSTTSDRAERQADCLRKRRAAKEDEAQIFTNKVARGVCSAWMRCGVPPYVVNDDSRGDRVHPTSRLSSCWLRVDRHQERLLAVLDLQEDCGIDGVAVCVELIGAGDAHEGRILHGIPDVRALDRAGSLECVEE